MKRIVGQAHMLRLTTNSTWSQCFQSKLASFTSVSGCLEMNIHRKHLSSSSSSSSASSFEHVPEDPSKIDWSHLGFSYVPTKAMVQYDWKDGKWSEGRLVPPILHIHAMSNVLHYGQACFEGLKAFHTKENDEIRAFCAERNAERLQRSALRLGMPQVSTEMFTEAIDIVVKENREYTPPYGSGGSLYLRPVLFGHGPKLGLGAADEYSFCVIANPVGAYYKTGIKPVDAVILKGYDRAAPHGIGAAKAAGNYAADVLPSSQAKERGFPIVLYLDAIHHKFVEEFSTSNLVAISKDGKKFITPSSESILQSVTNLALQTLAQDHGLKVEKRPVECQELGSFKEVAACGTAVVITPIKSITNDLNNCERFEYDSFETFQKLYNDVRAIQNGEMEDRHGFTRTICKRSS